MIEHLTIIQAWNELNKINNEIDLLETLITTKMDIGSSKLKEIMTSCSVTSNDKFINSIISKDENVIKLGGLYDSKNGYETYIRNEIRINKVSEPALCIAFLKEYYLKDGKRMTWDDIEKEMNLSKSQCKRYYYEDYKGQTPSKNSWHKSDVKLK